MVVQARGSCSRSEQARDTCLFCLHRQSLSVGATDKASLLPYFRKLLALSCGPRQENQSSWQTQPSVSTIKDGGNAPGVRMGALGSERINESEIPLRMGPGAPTPEPALEFSKSCLSSRFPPSHPLAGGDLFGIYAFKCPHTCTKAPSN